MGENYAVKAQWENINLDENFRDPTGLANESGNVFSILLEGVF